MESNPATNVKELVRNAKKGDAKSLDQLMRYVLRQVKPLVLMQVHDGAQEHDLCQEVLLKVYRYLPGFREESHLSTWIYRISQNTIKNHFRSQSTGFDIDEHDKAWDESQFSLQNPETLLIRIESNEIIDRAIASLGEELQTCYVKFVFDGKSYEDIAFDMHCPVGTVRSRIFRARQLIEIFIQTHS